MNTIRKRAKFTILVLYIGLVGVSRAQPFPDTTQASARQSIRYWEQIGFRDGESKLALKTCLAGGGSCLIGTVGEICLSSKLRSEGGFYYGPVIGGSIGCLGGWGIGQSKQKPPTPPASSQDFHEAYLRGYRRGERSANTTALLVGGGVTVLTALGFFTLLAWSMSWD